FHDARSAAARGDGGNGPRTGGAGRSLRRNSRDDRSRRERLPGRGRTGLPGRPTTAAERTPNGARPPAPGAGAPPVEVSLGAVARAGRSCLRACGRQVPRASSDADRCNCAEDPVTRLSVARAFSPLVLLACGALCAAERPVNATAQGESLVGVTSHFLHHDQ